MFSHNKSSRKKKPIVITISTNQGSKSFQISFQFRSILLGILVFGCIYSGLMTAMSAFFSHQYFLQQDQLSFYQTENSQLKKYKKNAETERAKIDKKYALDQIHQTALIRKKIILQYIPNGKPIQLPQFVVTSNYGNREHPVLGVEKIHHGIDIRASIGSPVLSTANGIVSFSGVKNGYGNVIIVDHAYGFQTIYAHLDERLIAAGSFVKKGDRIAKSGNTGRSSAPHLHYEVVLKNQSLDPVNFIHWNSDQFDYVFKNEKGVQWEFFIRKII